MGSIWKQAVADVAALLRCSALKAALRRRRLTKAPPRPKGCERRAALRHRKLRGTALRVRRILCGGEALEPRQMLSVTSYFWIGANSSDFNAADNWSLTSGGTADQTFPGGTDAKAVFDTGGASGTITISSAVTADEIDFEADGFVLSGAAISLIGADNAISVAPGDTATVSAPLEVASTFGKTGDGKLILTDCPSLAADSLTGVIDGGSLVLDANAGSPTVGSGVTAVLAKSASLELAGSVSTFGSATGNRVSIDDESTASAGIVVSGTGQIVGDIYGAGATQVDAGADLTADSIASGSLTIGGTAESPAMVTIADSSGPGPEVLYWDPNGTGGVTLGGTGYWDTSPTNYVWWNGTEDVGWTAGDVAIFSGTAGTVAVSSAITANDVIFATDGYLLDGTGSLDAVGFEVDSGLEATVATEVTGSEGVTLAGSGTLIVSGSNTYTGATIISSGTLRLATDDALGSSSEVTGLGGDTRPIWSKYPRFHADRIIRRHDNE